jgi:hypothetical protein
MIFGPSLVKEVDPPAISKMGPRFPKVAERDPKGAEPTRRRNLTVAEKMDPNLRKESE